jgi:two-component system, NarL family, sensor kinase
MWKNIWPKPSNDSSDLSGQIQRLASENERMLGSFDAMQDRFRGLARSAWMVQEDERRRLARELHDGVGQSLTALRHQLERLPESDERDVCAEMLLQILEDVRELSRLLRPPILDDLGLLPALSWLARKVRESSAISIELESRGMDQITLSPELSTLIFRLIQEALHNVVRHAGADEVRIKLFRTGNRIEIEVRDNGTGFDPRQLDEDPARRGVGIAGMRDRVELFGGDFSLRSAAGRGTSIQAGLTLDDRGETSA